MRTCSVRPVTSLLGSLGLHGCAVLVFVVAARRPVSADATPVLRADAWAAGNAIEVDAVASPGATPNIANAANAPEVSEPAPAVAPAEAVPTAPLEKPVEQAVVTPSTPTEVAPTPRKPPAKPKVKPKPRQAETSAEQAAAETGGSHDASTAAATGAFGAQGLPPGVSSLPSAFTRAITQGTAGDPIWQSLPSGTQAPFMVAVTVDAEGHISNAKILNAHDGAGVPAQFEHLRERVVALLGGGLFALKNNSMAGTDLMRITITLSDLEVPEDPATLVVRGSDLPRGNVPGRAYFTLVSGRHFEAKVEVLGQPVRPQHP